MEKRIEKMNKGISDSNYKPHTSMKQIQWLPEAIKVRIVYNTKLYTAAGGVRDGYLGQRESVEQWCRGRKV